MSTPLVRLEFSEIADERAGPHRLFLYGEYQSRSGAIRSAQNRADKRAMFPTTGGKEYRRVPSFRPGIADERLVGKSRFVQKTKGCFQAKPLF